ncbi:MAG TPA: hypothetical protein VGK25_01065 [Ignavibacteria bacterium]|jgi:hypothetical protein
MKRNFTILLCFIGIAFCSDVFSQNDDIRDKIEDIKLDKMTTKLSLDETTKDSFIDKYKAFSKDMRELNRKRAKAYKEMTENVESGTGLDTTVNKLLEYEKEINQKRTDFIADLKSMLTSQQIAKMIIFERKFNNEIKKILKQYQKENRKNFKE